MTELKNILWSSYKQTEYFDDNVVEKNLKNSTTQQLTDDEENESSNVSTIEENEINSQKNFRAEVVNAVYNSNITDRKKGSEFLKLRNFAEKIRACQPKGT